MRTERKIHREQMTPEQIAQVKAKVKAIDIADWSVTHHFIQRHKTKSDSDVGIMDMAHALNDFTVIEYKTLQYKHNSRVDERVVIRGNKARNSKNMVLVLSLRTKHIVTVWYNHEEDTHRTLDLSEYDASLKVI